MMMETVLTLDDLTYTTIAEPLDVSPDDLAKVQKASAKRMATMDEALFAYLSLGPRPAPSYTYKPSPCQCGALSFFHRPACPMSAV